MGATPLIPGFNVSEEDPKTRSIRGVTTATAGFVGVTQRGPFGYQQVPSFEDYLKIYGGYNANSDVVTAIERFFAGGGRNAYVSRIVHYTDVTDGSTKTSVVGTITLVDRAATPLSTIRVDGKTDGTYINGCKIKIEAGTSGVATEFNLVLLDASLVELERWSNLTMTTTASNYFATVINDAKTGSNLIKVADLASASAPPTNMPAILTTAVMASGNDGLASIADTDYIGSATGGTGINAFDLVGDINLLAIPGRSSAAAVAVAMSTYCATTRGGSMFPIFDCQAGRTCTQMASDVASFTVSEFGSVFYPRIKVLNPNKTVYGAGTTITIPPSGFVLGAIAAADDKVGPWQAPAGVDFGLLPGAIALESEEINNDAKYALLYPKCVNGIRSIPGGGGIYIDGDRTLKLSGNWPTIPQRRTAIFIEQSIKNGLLFAKFLPNTPKLRAQVRRTITAFLNLLLGDHAFASDDPSQAFSVDVSDALNPPSVVAAGKMVIRIGLAIATPAEFFELKFSADTRALDADRANSR